MRVFLHFLPDSKPQKTRKTNQISKKQIANGEWQMAGGAELSPLSRQHICISRLGENGKMELLKLVAKAPSCEHLNANYMQ